MTAPAPEKGRYQSFVQLCERHNQLQQLPDKALAASDVVDFLIYARETGRVIAEGGERSTAQAIINYWSAELVRHGEKATVGLLQEFDPDAFGALPDSACPFVGARPFEEPDAKNFFGRQGTLSSLQQVLARRRLVIVSGRSGSGKSSVVRAGVVPWLKSEKKIETVLTLMPGLRPFHSLAVALTAAGIHANAAELQTNTQALSHAIADRSPCAIIVDQFEELFTLSAGQEDLQDRFVAALMNAFTAGNWLVIVTRDDFEEVFPRFPALNAQLEICRVSIGPASAEELRELISRPAEAINLFFEEGLIDDLVSKIVGEPAGLPLLQFTLRKLWESRHGNLITWNAYRQIGNPREALARTAEHIFANLAVEDQNLLKKVFLRLVRPSHYDEFVSNRVPAADVLSVGPPNQVELIVTRLIDAGLLRATAALRDPECQLAVAHEAVIRNWPKLTEWLQDERERMRARLRLTSAAEDWLASGRDKGGLLAGKLLRQAEELTDLNEFEREFVQASQDFERAAEQEKEQAQLRQVAQAQALAEEQRQRADEKSRALRRMRRMAAGIVVAMCIALAFLAFAIVRQRDLRVAETTYLVNLQEEQKAAQTARDAARTRYENDLEAKTRALEDATKAAEVAKKEAERQRDRADRLSRESVSRELSALAVGNLSTDPQLSLLLAAKAGDETSPKETQLLPETRAALHQSLLRPRPLITSKVPMAVSPLPLRSGDAFVWVDLDGTIKLRDLLTEKIRSLGSVDPAFRHPTLAFVNPNGDLCLLTPSQELIIRLADPTKKQIKDLPAGNSSSVVMAVSRSGDVVVRAARFAKLDVISLAAVPTLQQSVAPLTGAIFDLAVSPSGRFVAATYRTIDNQIAYHVWDLKQAKPAEQSPGRIGPPDPTGHVWSFIDDQRMVLTPYAMRNTPTSGNSGIPVIRRTRLDNSDRVEDQPLGSNVRTITSVAVSQYDDALAIGTDQGAVELWELSDRERPRSAKTFSVPRRPIRAVQFDRAVTQVVATASDGTVDVWPLLAPVELASTRIKGIVSLNAQWSASVDSLATILVRNHERQVAAWTATGRFSYFPLDTEAGVIALTPDGKVAVLFNGSELTVWKAGHIDRSIPLPLSRRLRTGYGRTQIVLSADGTHLAIGQNRHIYFYSLVDGTPAREIPLKGALQTIAISRNGRNLGILFATGSLLLYDTVSDRQKFLPLPLVKVADSELPSITSDSELRRVTSFDPDDDSIDPLEALDNAIQGALQFSEDGGSLAVSVASNITVVDAASGEAEYSLPGTLFRRRIAFSANKEYIAAASSSTLELWRVAQTPPQNGPASRSGGRPNTYSVELQWAIPASVSALAFAADSSGLAMVIGSDITTLSIQDKPLLLLAKKSANRVLTLQECKKFPLHSSPECRARDLFEEAVKLASEEKVSSASEVLRRAQKLSPSMISDPEGMAKTVAAQAAAQRARQWAEIGALDGASNEFRVALRLQPQLHIDADHEPRRIYAKVVVDEAIEAGLNVEFAQALEKFRKAKELDPQLRIDPDQEARRYSSRGLLEDAYAIAEAQVEEPDSGYPRVLDDYRKAHELDPTAVSDPEQSALRLVTQQLTERSGELATTGNITQALTLIGRADKLAPSRVFANSWNTVCWYGALYGHAADVLSSCDRAVSMDKEIPGYRDSRAVARALSGHSGDAIADFDEVLQSKKLTPDFRELRQSWRDDLARGTNPFTKDVIKRLLGVEFGGVIEVD